MSQHQDPSTPNINVGMVGQSAPVPPGARHINLVDVPIDESIRLSPREETREVEDVDADEEVKRIQIPHTEIREEFEEVDVAVKKDRYTNAPRMNVLHRKIKIPKPVKQQRIVEMPQLHVVDKITEKYEDIVKEKYIEKPKYIIQERIIPIPKRQVEEITVRVPQDKFDEIVNAQLGENALHLTERAEIGTLPNESLTPGGLSPESPKTRREAPAPVKGPRFRRVPKPVEVPMMHYKPVPVERLVDRNVPVPVELHVTQEYQCPLLVPTWAEAAVPVHVTRVIEKPVPADALNNKLLLSMYMAQTQNIDKFAEERHKKQTGLLGSCRGATQSFPVRQKMTDAEIRAAGLEHNLSTLKTMNSRTMSQFQPFNASVSGGFLTSQRTIQKDKTAEAIMKEMGPEGTAKN